MPDLLAAFARVTQAGTRWTAACPAHEDRRNSLSIARGEDGRWLVKCHAGCALEAILTAAHLTVGDLFSSNGNGHGARVGDVLATYDYRDADGTLLYQVVRYAPKSFRPRRPDGAGGWIANLNDTKRVLYHLAELQQQRTVYVVEGEKDADRLSRLGLPATSCGFGAGKWIADYTAQLRAAGCRLVVVLPDNDPPGAAHGRMVARSCADAGLSVKLVPLPDLPAKGDVSDYLEQHTAADLAAIIADAPLFDPARSVAEAPALTLTSMADFVEESPTAYAWIVADRIRAASVVLFCGAPKAGKSTAVRELAAAVARGEPWLGWQTTRGAVWLLAFEDHRSEVWRHLVERLGVTAETPLWLRTGPAPADLLAQMRTRALAERPTLIIIDTLVRVLRVKDINDYAQVATACEPWLELARATGATLVLVHHASVHSSRDGLDAILGSSALAGSVDNVLVLRRIDGRRVLSSVQRSGVDLPPTIVTLDARTGRLACAGTKHLVEDRELREQVLEAIAAAGEPVRESWLQNQVEGRKKDQVRALRILLSQGRVERLGRGGRGDPYLYRLADAGSQIPPSGGRKTNGQEPPFPEKRSMNPGLFEATAILVPENPVYSVQGTPAVRGEVRTTDDRTYHHDAMLVPEPPPAAQTDPATHEETPDKHGADSGSQILATGDADERF